MTAANSSGKIITFYSYKGGTGRSMALANVAWVLASNGRRVLAVDWDLEAPGLHRYLYPFLVDKELTSSEGVIDFMIDFECEALTPLKEGETLDKDWYKPHADILRYAASLDWEFPGAGTLDFIPAGRQGDSYSSRVTSFNWQNFYDRLGGGAFLEAVKQRMREEYDYVLIDSRTGVSDASGICTVQLPDTLVVCFTLNHQSIEGAAAVATSVYEQRRNLEPSIQILPVPMRIENGEKDKLDLRRQYARQQFDPFPTHIPHKRTDYWGAVEVLYIPYYAYEEILAPFGDKRGQTVSLLASFERLTAYLTQDDPHGEVNRVIAPAEGERQRVLAEYAREFSEATVTEEQLEALDEAQVNAAENMFASLSPEQQTIARRVFSRLVRVAPPEEVGGDTRLRVKKTDLGTAAKPILDDLLYQQLVLLGQDEETNEETLELADDALLQNWKRMHNWLAEDHDFLLWRQGLQLGIAKWKDTGRDEAALLRGAFLTEAEHYRATWTDALTDHESAFIVKSTEAESMRRQAENELRQKEAEARLETVKVRKEKKRVGLKVGAVIIALLLVLAGAYSFIFSREKTLVYLGWQPPRYLGEWKDQFLITGDRKPDQSLWVYPAQGQWLIDKGQGEASDDGALLVNGPNIGELNIKGEATDNGNLVVNWTNIGVSNIKGAALYDFTADFKVRIVKGKKAAWVFRAQSEKQNGYVFVLEKGNPHPVLNGYIYSGGKSEALDNYGAREIPFRDCCNWDDAFRIRAEVKGNEFRLWITVESNSDPDNPWLLRMGDLQEPAVIAGILRDSQDPVPKYLRTQFNGKTQKLLTDYKVGELPAETLRNALTDELNRLLKGTSFLEKEGFTDVKSETVQCLIDQNPKGKSLIRLNRLLLEAAFPVAIATSEGRSDTAVEYFIEPFKDDRSLFPYGNVGLFDPEAGGQMKVEYMSISAPPVNRLALQPGK